MNLVPVMVDLRNQKIIVIGGGKIAQRRINTLMDHNAIIEVISPKATEAIQTLSKTGQIEWKEKGFEEADLVDAFLIIVATNNSRVNQLVIESAPKHALINAVEDAKQGNVQFPIYFERGKLSIAISTNGSSPTLATKIKNDLENQYDDRYEAYMDFLFKARQLVKDANLVTNVKKELLQALITDSLLESNKHQHALKQLKLDIHRKSLEQK